MVLKSGQNREPLTITVFYAQEPVYIQKAGNRSNRGSTARF